MTTFLKKVPVPLAALLLLALMPTLQAFGQPEYSANIIVLADFSVQDGATTIEVEGTCTFTNAEALFDEDERKGHRDEIDVLSWSWVATTEASRFDFEAGGSITRCETSTLKETTFELDGLPISVQLCSTQDGPLTITPGSFEIPDAPAGDFFLDTYESFRSLGGSASHHNEKLQMSIRL